MCLLLTDRGGSLKRLHRPNLLEVCCIRFKEKVGFQDRGGSTLIAPQRGPYEASEGIYPGHGQEKLRVGKYFKMLDKEQRPLHTESGREKATGNGQ